MGIHLSEARIDATALRPYNRVVAKNIKAQALWHPSKTRVASANITSFQRTLSQHLNKSASSYADLHRWSVKSVADFWEFYAEYAKLPFTTPPQEIISSDPMPYTKWFKGATINYAEAMLFPKGVNDTQIAIIALNERGEKLELTYQDLRQKVASCMTALKTSGVSKGDRVAAYIGNTPEAVVLFLACSTIGAIFSSGSPDFGYKAALARFGQIEPKLLVASDSYWYNGKEYLTRDVIKRLQQAISSVQKVVYIAYGASDKKQADGLYWQDWLHNKAEELSFASLDFDHPLYILYSSGTTGSPKAMVHRAGGVLLKHHVEHKLHLDIKPGDTVFYFTTCGWMMWNWLVSALGQGTSIVLFEGSPNYPDLTPLWELVASNEVSFFGTGASFIHSCKASITPKELSDFPNLRTIASTGSPLSVEGFRWVYKTVKKDVHLASISGGTDIVGCFMLGCPTLPVFAGQIQVPALGVDLAVYNSNAEPVVGEVGELICRQPLPSMPLYFWQDKSFKRYQDAYFKHFEGVWRHGDLIEIAQQGGIVAHGRSDSTLNPGGVRIGTAEIYRPLENLPEVLEALAVGKREHEDEVIWLFVVLQKGIQLSENLEKQIKEQIRLGASPRHVPKRILQVSQLPHTHSGKVTEIAVSHLINGRDVPNRDVLANPEALDEITVLINTQL